MLESISVIDFYKNKKVFVTGHTGFKGSWLCEILTELGAEVRGYALDPPTNPSLFELAGIKDKVDSVIGDIRDFNRLNKAVREFSPEIVFHLAAQPIVRASYKNPRDTYEINVMGTVNLLEIIRNLPDTPKSVVNVTTDKVYQNNEWVWGYRENDPLDGFDPYSNSKSCSELATHSYKSSFFDSMGIAVSTARAGNVIGGGDFANDRIIPDCVRAIEKNEVIKVRNPYSVRPYQHVLEPLFAYLLIAKKQYENSKFSGYYNVGPDDEDCVSTGTLVDLFCKAWGEGASWMDCSDKNGPHEANFLKLYCSKIKAVIGWRPCFYMKEAVEKTVEWTKAYLQNGDNHALIQKQITEYLYGNI
jgi:CDP-glucose 4,6-dehydratase